MAVIKDFRWEKTETGWFAQPCPLGQGMVDVPRFLKLLKSINFHGPISLHFEYPLGGAERGARELALEPDKILHSMRADLQLLRNWLTQIELD
jgi:sugar phosphate isomerase/epimerase